MSGQMEHTDLSRFFAWARARAYREYDARISADPALDPNWTFSDIMQRLLTEYRELSTEPTSARSEETETPN
ncbi:MAG: hypothetical protein ACKV2V_25350 [Blastocatellia bacterium]